MYYMYKAKDDQLPFWIQADNSNLYCVIFDFIKMDNYHVNHCLHLLGRNCSEYSLF